MIGLGRMGANMARRLLRTGHRCTVYDHKPTSVSTLEREGAIPAASLAELVEKLSPPRLTWIMLPAGQATEAVVSVLGDHLKPGDVIVDGGNSYYKDDVRRAQALAAKSIHYVDVGTSGGVWGLERGYCLMVGGPNEAVRRIDPILKALAPGRGDIPRTPGRMTGGGSAEEGYLHCGPSGAGHYVKMIHNGIEYGLMQAYAEGFDLLRSAASDSRPEAERYGLNVANIAELWRRGSVIGSWLLDLTAQALAEDPDLAAYAGSVEDSGEGRWTVMTAIENAVPADVLSAALYARFRSRQQHTFAEKVLSAMREKFGGHAEKSGES